MELQALAPFRSVGRAEFDKQATKDFALLGLRLQTQFRAASLNGIVVYPSGSAHQIMPPTWAVNHLPNATFVFHTSDSDGEQFPLHGLHVERFRTPEDMLELGHMAGRILVTDSFPSHVWQLMGERVVVLLTEQIRSRTVHPGFPLRQIVESRASCCPCRHLDRGNHRLCVAGHQYCTTWSNCTYVLAFERLVTL